MIPASVCCSGFKPVSLTRDMQGTPMTAALMDGPARPTWAAFKTPVSHCSRTAQRIGADMLAGHTSFPSHKQPEVMIP